MAHESRNNASPLPRPAIVDCVRTDPGDLVAWAMRIDAMAEVAKGTVRHLSDPSGLQLEDQDCRPLSNVYWTTDGPLRLDRTVHGPSSRTTAEPFTLWTMERHPAYSKHAQYVVEIPVERVDGDDRAMMHEGRDPASELRTLADILRSEAACRLEFKGDGDRPERDALRAMTPLAERAHYLVLPILAPFQDMELEIAARAATPWTRAWIHVHDRAMRNNGGRRGHYEIEAHDVLASPICISLAEIETPLSYTLRVSAASTMYRTVAHPEDPVMRMRNLSDERTGDRRRVMRRLHRHLASEDLGAGRSGS